MAELSRSLIFAAVAIVLLTAATHAMQLAERLAKLMAIAIHIVETKTPKAQDPNATRAASHIAQAWAILGEMDCDEARAVRITLRALVPQVERIRPQRTRNT